MASSKWKYTVSLALIGCLLLLNFISSVYCQGRGDGIPIDDEEPTVNGYIIHSVPANWEDAARVCGMDPTLQLSPEEHRLLCFESRLQIMKVFPQKDHQNLSIWLSSRNCNSRYPEWCLYLVIRKHKDELFLEFENNCQRKLGFVCRIFLNEKPKSLSRLQTNPKPGSDCHETKRRNITWPSSPMNTNVSMKCPGHMRGYARWFCNGTTGDWGPGQPNLADCRTVALSDVLTTVEEDLSDPHDHIIDLQKTARDLRQMVRNLQTGGDLTTTVQILDRVEDIFVSQAPAMPQAKKKEIALETSGHVINVCNQLLTKSEAWEDLEVEDRYLTATTLLTTVDETGSILATNIEKRKHDILTANIVVTVTKPEKSKRVESFIGHGMNNLTLTVPPSTKYVVFASYADLREILPLYRDGGGLHGKIVNSAVMSANTSGRQFVGKVHVRLTHFNQTLMNPSCVFWDVRRQEWSSDGCVLSESNNQFTVCECDHLTNFAVLMDMYCATCNLDEEEKAVLSIITIIGCSVSIFCLSVCIVIFTFYKSLWSMQVMIHRNLCITLLIAQAILLGGLDRTENKTVCACIAALLHYFFLSAFFWMFLEAFHILWLLVKVFKPKRSHSAKYYLAGYGGPLVFLAVNLAFKHKGYGTMHFCWLNSQDGTIWGFIAPVLVIILFNSSTLAYALFVTHNLVKRTETSQLNGIKLWVRGAAVLMPLLGVTWIVGFLYVERNFIIFAYIFAVLNSSQGIAIFIFHCVLNKKVKERVANSLRISIIYRSKDGRNSKSRLSKSPTTVSTPTKKRPTSNFFFNQDHTQPVNDNPPQKNPNTVGKEGTPFLQETADDRNRTNTNELYPLEVEKG